MMMPNRKLNVAASRAFASRKSDSCSQLDLLEIFYSCQ